MLKKILCISISALALISSLMGGGLSFSAKPPFSVYAEELSEGEKEDNATIKPGEYAIPLKYNTGATISQSLNDNPGNNSLVSHFYARALLTVSENGTQSLTIGVESWSLYDVFVPVNQANLTDSKLATMKTGSIPSALLKDNSFLNSSLFKTSDEINDAFLWKNIDTKYGDITIVKYDEMLDIAYITFEIVDYTQPIQILRWFNTPTSSLKSKIAKKSVGGYTTLVLDSDSIESIDEIKSAVSNNAISATLLCATNYGGKTASANLADVCFAGVPEVKTLIDHIDTTVNNDDSISVKYYLGNDSSGSLPNHIMIPVQKHISNPSTYQTWTLSPSPESKGDSLSDVIGDDEFDSLDIKQNEQGYYFELSFDNIEELLFGQYIYCDMKDSDNNTSLAIFMPCLTTKGHEKIRLTYSENGKEIVVVNTDTSRFSADTRLVVEKNNAAIIDAYYSSPTYDKEKMYIYTISFEDEFGNQVHPKGSVDVCIQLPDDFSFDNYYNGTIAKRATISLSRENLGNSTIEKQYDLSSMTWNLSWQDADGATYSIIKLAEVNNDITMLADGVYKTYIDFRKVGTDATFSMSNAALVHDAYVVISTNENNDKVRKLYFNMHDMSVGSVSGFYIGDTYCNDPKNSGKVFKESTHYLKFATNADGTLLDNCGYNSITEWGCVQRAAIILEDESYNQSGKYYSIAVSSPAMASIASEEYENVADDDLTVELVFSSFEEAKNADGTDMTEDDVKALFPYDVSALTRQVELAKIKLNSKKSFSTDSIAKVQTAYDAVLDAFDGTYNPLNKAEISADKLEKLGTNLENAIKALDGITVAGYNAQLDKDVTFDFYLSMNKNNLEAAQDGDLKANITKADGSTETVEVGEDGKIEFNVAPKEIGQTLKVKIGSYEFTYSVQEYLEKLIWYAENPTEGVEVSDKDAAIAKSLLVYGGYAQDYFVKKDAEANAYVDTERAYVNVDNTLPETADNATTFTVPQLGDNIKYYGAAVVFDYTTDIRLYFTVDDAIENHSFAVNDKAVDAVAVDGGYYIAIENIYANQLGNPFKITVDGTDFQYGVYNYIAAALNATEVKSGALNELQALVKALYQYAELTKTTA